MKFKTLDLEIDGEVFKLQEISARQRQELFKLYKGDADPVEAQAASIKMGCPAFKDKALDEILDMPGTVFAALADGVMKLSGLGDDKEDEKNS